MKRKVIQSLKSIFKVLVYTLNTNKDYDSIKYMPIGIRYNDSVWFSDYQALLGGNRFPDRNEYIKKLNKKK